MSRFARSLTLRLLLAAGLWIAATLTAGGYVLSLAFRDYVVTDFDARLAETLDHMVGASEIDENGMLRFIRPLADPRYSEPYSGLYWQVTVGDEPPFRSRSLWDEALAPTFEGAVFNTEVTELPGPDSQRLRLMARDVLLPDADGVFRYMVAGDTAQIRRDIRKFDRLIISSLGFLGAALLLAVALQVWVGLMPLKTVRRGLMRVRSGRARRLEGDYPVEIAPLVEEVNALLEHNEKVVERARTHVGNLAHALKTPVTVLKGEARTGDTPLARILRSQIEIIDRHIDHHLKRARAAGGSLVGSAVDVSKPLADLVRAMTKIHAARGLDISLHLPPGLRFRGTEQDLTEMIGNLLDNACKWARSRVRVSVCRIEEPHGRPMLEIRIEDDGPGIAEAELERLFERGRRLDTNVPGDGLGLAIVRDIAEMCGGDVRLGRSVLGGLLAVLILPAAE